MTGPDELHFYGMRVTKREYVESYRTYRGHMDTPTMSTEHYANRRLGNPEDLPDPAPGTYEDAVIDDWLLEAGLIKDSLFRSETRPLAEGLGAQFLADLLGGTAGEWEGGHGPIPRDGKDRQKVYEAWYAYTAVANAHGPDAARDWMYADRRPQRLRAGEQLRDEARTRAVEGHQLEITAIIKPAAEDPWAGGGWWGVAVAEVPDFRMLLRNLDNVEDQVIQALAQKTGDYSERFILRGVKILPAPEQDLVTQESNAAFRDSDLDSDETSAWLTENAKRMLADVDWDQAPSDLTPAGRLRFAATEQAWREIEQEFGLPTADEVAERIGRSVAEVNTAHRDGHLLAVHRGGRLLFPGFQLKPGDVHPAFARLHRAAARLGVREASVLLWMISPIIWWTVEGSRPVDHLDDPKVMAAFESHFGAEW